MNLQRIKYWNYRHAFVMLLAGVLVLALRSLLPVLLLGSLSFIIFAYAHRSLLASFRPFAGYANWVTFGRLLLTILLGSTLQLLPPLAAFAIVLIIIALDGLDGYLARRHQHGSDFGMYLDFETDTFWVCLLSCHFYLEDMLGLWILGIGFMRYIYVVLIILFGLQDRKEKSTRFAKTIAVLLFFAMLTPFLLPASIYRPVVAVACIIVLLSFGRSFVSLLRA